MSSGRERTTKTPSASAASASSSNVLTHTPERQRRRRIGSLCVTALVWSVLALVLSFVLLAELWPRPALDVAAARRAAARWATDAPSDSCGNDVDVDHPLRDVRVVVTGGTSGLGRSIVETFLRWGATVIVLGRSQDKLATLRRRESEDDDDGPSRLVTVACDLADLDAVSRAADAIVARFDALDLLILNAGVGGHRSSSDPSSFAKVGTRRFDRVLVVNFLSQVALSHRLLPLLEKSSRRTPRVVQVSSSYHWKVDGSDLVVPSSSSSSDGDGDDPIASSSAEARRDDAYANSKFAQIAHGRASDRRARARGARVRTVSVCPGWVATGLSADASPLLRWAIRRYGLSADGAGIDSVLRAAFADDDDDDDDDYRVNLREPGRELLRRALSGGSRRRRALLANLLLCAQIPVQNLLHRARSTTTSARSAPETYDEDLQDRLYEWSARVTSR